MSDVQAKINALWDGASAEYDSRPSHGFHDHAHEAAWKDALRSLLPPPPADVLDVGTGTGVIAMALADLGYAVRGVDLSEGMLAHARRKASERGGDVRFEIGDAIDPPGDPETVDAVINRHVLWTLTDPERALSNWRRLLRPGGRLVVIDGLWGRTGDDRLGDDIASALPLMQRETKLDDVRALVKRARFTGVRISTLEQVDEIERAFEDDHATGEPHYVVTASKGE